jgi:hypothetical protein
MWHVCRRREIHTGFWWGNLKRRDHLEDLNIGGILKLILKEQYRRGCNGLI